MVGVDKVYPQFGSAEKVIVFHIGGNVCVAAKLKSTVQTSAAGASHDRNALYGSSCVVIPQAVGVKGSFAKFEKIVHLNLLRVFTDSSAAVGVERSRHGTAQRSHKCIVDAALGNVEISVHTHGSNVIFYELYKLSSLFVVG